MASHLPAFATAFVPRALKTTFIQGSLKAAAKSSGSSRRITTRAQLTQAKMQNPDIKRLQPGARFNQAVIHNGIVYLSGQVARGTNGDVAAQTRAILAKIDALLEEAGTNKSRLLSANIWMTDISRVAEMNAEWSKWVDKDNMPVRATVQSSLVDDEITVEIQAIAAMPSLARSIATKEAAAAVGPYNQGVIVEDGTVYVSGCIGLTADTAVMAGSTIEDQTKQTLSNLKAILESAGAGIGDIVKTTILLDDIADFAKVNTIYSSFFEGHSVPARSCFAAKQLPKGALVEIDAIAKLPC